MKRCSASSRTPTSTVLAPDPVLFLHSGFSCYDPNFRASVFIDLKTNQLLSGARYLVLASYSSFGSRLPSPFFAASTDPFAGVDPVSRPFYTNGLQYSRCSFSDACPVCFLVLGKSDKPLRLECFFSFDSVVSACCSWYWDGFTCCRLWRQHSLFNTLLCCFVLLLWPQWFF